MKNAQATIRDIAIKLGISISTVSRALRGVSDINPKTKQAVLEMAAKLEYEPNKIAQSLRLKKTNILGVIVPEIAINFFSIAISSIQEYASSRGYSIIICQSMESYEIEKSNVQMLVSNRIDGLLISLSIQTENFVHLQHVIDKKIPLVLFDRISNDLNVSKVMVDDHDGAYKAVDYLIKTGCRRIGYIGGPQNFYISQHRERGYKDALVTNNLPVDEALVIHCDNLREDNVLKAIEKMIILKPDAIFCFTDPVAIIAIQFIKSKGIKIPDEISVIGFTNELVSAFIEPSLTTVSQPACEIGKIAAQLLIDQINSVDVLTPETVVTTTELIIRNSTRKLPD